MKRFYGLMLCMLFAFTAIAAHPRDATTKNDVGKFSFQKQTAVQDVNLNVVAYNYDFLMQPFIASVSPSVPAIDRLYVVPQTIGTSDTKRFIRWLICFQKIC